MIEMTTEGRRGHWYTSYKLITESSVQVYNFNIYVYSRREVCVCVGGGGGGGGAKTWL